MDKFEYELKVEQIGKLIKRGDYATAKKIADTMEWKKEKSPKLLRQIAELYYEAEDYAYALKILSMAYSVSKRGAIILSRMCEIALISGKPEMAEEFCDEYKSVKGEDSDYFMFRYQIAEAEGADLNLQIHYLEEYCKLELDEEACLKLARMYEIAGKQGECLAMCNFIIDIFCFGEVVDEAVKLKSKYEQLDVHQEKIVANKEIYKKNYEDYLENTEEAEDRRKRESEQMKKALDEQFMDKHQEELGREISGIVSEQEKEKSEIHLDDLVADEILTAQKTVDASESLIADELVVPDEPEIQPVDELTGAEEAVADEKDTENIEPEITEISEEDYNVNATGEPVSVDELEAKLVNELESEIEASKEITEDVTTEVTTEEPEEVISEETQTEHESAEIVEEAEAAEENAGTTETAEPEETTVVEETADEEVPENNEASAEVTSETEDDDYAEIPEEVLKKAAYVVPAEPEPEEVPDDGEDDGIENVAVDETETDVTTEVTTTVRDEIITENIPAEEAAEENVEETVETTEEVIETVEEPAAEAIETVEEAVETWEEPVQETVEEVEEVTEAAEEPAEVVEEVTETVEAAAEQSEETKEEEQPVAVPAQTDEEYMAEIEKTLAAATEAMKTEEVKIEIPADAKSEPAKLKKLEKTQNIVVEPPKKKKKKNLTSALEISIPTDSFIVYADNAELGSSYAYELIRREDKNIRPMTIAKISAEKINECGFDAVKEQLEDDLLMITDAGACRNNVLDKLNSWLRADDGNFVVLIDTQENITGVTYRRERLMKKFTQVYKCDTKTTEEWLDIAEKYVDTQDCILDDDAVILLKEYLEEKNENGEAVVGIVIREALDEAVANASARHLFSGPEVDDDGRTIVLAKHFS